VEESSPPLLVIMRPHRQLLLLASSALAVMLPPLLLLLRQSLVSPLVLLVRIRIACIGLRELDLVLDPLCNSGMLRRL